MVEQAAEPEVHGGWQRLLKVGRVLTNPLRPDGYLALINPKWSTREATGTVVRVEPEPDGAATVVIRPTFGWPGHAAGQYLRLGAEIDGIRHWRAYSITSDPRATDGLVSVTVKRVGGGKLSPFFTDRLRPGALLFLGSVEGEFALPQPRPPKLLMISAGSGITPISSMLRELDHQSWLPDVVHLHSARTAEQMIFGPRLRALASREPGYRLIERHTASNPRLEPSKLDALVPDWRERPTLLSGPREMIDAFQSHWAAHGDPALLQIERFQPVIGTGDHPAGGSGGTVHFMVTEVRAECPPGVSILVGAEQAGGVPVHGCRMGICHTCVGRLRSGQLRDLRTGTLHSEPGQTVRICVNAPEGHVEIEL